MCLAQGPQRNDAGEARTCGLRVKHSTTEPLRSLLGSAHVLMNSLNELGKRDKMQGLLSILSLFATSLINSITQVHEC